MASGHALARVSPAGGTDFDGFDGDPPQLAKVIARANAEKVLKTVTNQKLELNLSTLALSVEPVLKILGIPHACSVTAQGSFLPGLCDYAGIGGSLLCELLFMGILN